MSTTTTDVARYAAAVAVARTTLTDRVQAHADAQRALDVATRHRNDAIRDAVAVGVSVADVAAIAKVNRARVYQVIAPDPAA